MTFELKFKYSEKDFDFDFHTHVLPSVITFDCPTIPTNMSALSVQPRTKIFEFESLFSFLYVWCIFVYFNFQNFEIYFNLLVLSFIKQNSACISFDHHSSSL